MYMTSLLLMKLFMSDIVILLVLFEL